MAKRLDKDTKDTLMRAVDAVGNLPVELEFEPEDVTNDEDEQADLDEAKENWQTAYNDLVEVCETLKAKLGLKVDWL